MRLVTIESSVYKVTEETFQNLKTLQKLQFEEPTDHDREMDLQEYIDENIHKFRLVGEIEFDHRL